MRTALLLALASLARLAAADGKLPPDARSSAVAPMDDEEYDVLSAVLDAHDYPGDPLVLAAATESGGVPRLGDRRMAADYQARNRRPALLDATRIRGRARVMLLTSDEARRLFDDRRDDGWDRFYALYPGALSGIVRVSRPGFDATHGRAVVYVGSQSHWLAGAGYSVLLVKRAGVWRVEKRAMTWIS